jgi:MFS family permease
MNETQPHSRAQFFLVVSVVVLYWSGLYLYVPTLPVYAQTKTELLEMVGVVIAMYGLWQALLRLPLGIVSDWVGRRKPFILVGLALVGVGAWMMGSAGDIMDLVVGRSITGLSAATWVLLVVVFSSLFPPREAVRASAILSLAGSLSRFAATSLNGVLNNLGGYPLAFYLAAGLAALSVLLYAFVREAPRPRKTPSLGVTGRLVTRQDVLVPSLVSAVFHYLSMASTFGFIPILAKNMGAGNVEQSLMVSMSIGVFALGNFAASWAARRTSSRTIIYLSLAIVTAGILIGALAPSLSWVYLAQFLTGFAGGLSYPVLMGMSIEKVDEDQRSTAMGLHQSVYAIGMFAGPWLSGILADAIGIQPMFAVSAAIALVLGLVGMRWLGKQRPQ